jgi:hypothetical protein
MGSALKLAPPKPTVGSSLIVLFYSHPDPRSPSASDVIDIRKIRICFVVIDVAIAVVDLAY